MPISLTERTKTEQDPIKKNIIEIFPKTSPILEAMEFVNAHGGVFKYNQESIMPGLAFRGVYEGYSESTGVLQQNVETTKIFGGKSTVDRALVSERGESVGELRAIYDRLKAKALALFFTKMFFDGDSSIDPRQFDGLNARLIGNQVMTAGENGASLTIDMLDDLIDKIAGSPDMLLMSKAMRREVTKLLRQDGRINYGVDAFGRQVTTYGGIPIRIIEEDHQGAEVLGFDETIGSADNCGSIYAIRFGAEEYVCGIQNQPMDIIDMGLQSDLCYLTVIEWLASFVILHPKASARLQGVTAS